MDVDMEMNGHSQSMKPTTDYDADSHNAHNLEASISHAEAMSSLPSKPLVTVPPTEAAAAAPEQLPPPIQQAFSISLADQVAPSEPAENGFHTASSAPVTFEAINGDSTANGVNGKVSAPAGFPAEEDSRRIPVMEPWQDPTSSAQPTTSLDTDVPAPSLLAESLPGVALASQTASASMVPEIGSILNQAPTSNLRSSPPPPGAISPEEAMQLRAEKEQHDIASDPSLAHNLAAEPVESNKSPVPPVVPAAQQPTAVGSSQDLGVDEGVEMDNSYDTPPVNDGSTVFPSPPPAPEPAPARLPSETLQEPATETIIPAIASEAPLDPAPTPVEPEAAKWVQSEASVDAIMTDIASPPVKIAREREEDIDDAEPQAKRAKTEVEGEPTDFKVPDAPSGADSPAFTDEDDSVTQPRLAHMKKIISNLKKSNASTYFRIPVDIVALNIPQYPDIVKAPMDLSKIDNKLKQGQYSSVHDFVTDFELIVGNSIIFNGRDHAVSQAALKMQGSFKNQMANMPKAGVVEPSKEEKRAQKLKVEATRVIPQRRPSVTASTSRPAAARSPPAPTSTQTFAVGPEGVPLIRRDSNVNDGRPKRAIIPSKRNSEFGSSSRPKKKKYELQLKFCAEVLKELKNSKHWQINQFFVTPVDPVALNIPTYFQVIKKPMDLSTVQHKLDTNEYEKAKDFEEDIRLIFKNCYKFNAEGEWVNQAGHKLEEMFDKKWESKDDWIASRQPDSEPQSDGDEEGEEDEESEEEEEEEESDSDERNQKIIQLQKQIEAMSKQMGELAQPKKKKKSTPPVPAKKPKSKPGKKEKQASTFPNLKPKDKKKSGSKPKADKEKYVNITFAEKQYISNGISQLPDKQMNEALKIIQNNVPRLANTNETEVELDIEDVPNHVLQKLLVFVKKYAGPPPEEPKSEVPVYSAATATGGSGKPKKNKPMSKEKQEQQIQELKGKLGQYASGMGSPEAIQSIETGGESSDDEVDSEESEEE